MLCYCFHRHYLSGKITIIMVSKVFWKESLFIAADPPEKCIYERKRTLSCWGRMGHLASGVAERLAPTT